MPALHSSLHHHSDKRCQTQAKAYVMRPIWTTLDECERRGGGGQGRAAQGDLQNKLLSFFFFFNQMCYVLSSLL